jgi:Asp-tRNA(Asn)/Glu-tRNA(Gln) amidotransferase A subunit family amidase
MQRISLKDGKSLPLLNQSIKTINELLISGQLSAYDLCLKCLERIEKTKQLNAFITITKDIAINQSIESNKRFKNGIYFELNSIIK